MTKALIYVRLSPTPRDEGSKGGNLDQQESMCRSRCEAEGWDVVDVVVDKDTSATSKKPRKGWARAVDMVRTGDAQVIVSRHYDRMYRKLSDLEELVALAESAGVELVACEVGKVDLSTATGRAQARYMAVGAALETELKAERQALGHQRRLEAGRGWWMHRPLGYELDYTVRESEAVLVRQAYADVLAGRSLSSIVGEWNELDITTTHGKRWRVTGLRSVLLAHRNAGILTHHRKEVGPAPWPALVDEETYRAVVRLLSDPSRKAPRARSGRTTLLAGFAVCGVCEAPVRTKSISGRRCYLCPKGCASAHMAWVDERTVALLLERLTHPDFDEQLTPTLPNAQELLDRLHSLRLKGRRYAAMLDDEEIDEDQFGVLNRANRRKMAELQARVDTVSAIEPLLSLRQAEDMQAAWDGFSVHKRHAIASGFYRRIALHPKNGGKGSPPGVVEWWPKGLDRPVRLP